MERNFITTPNKNRTLKSLELNTGENNFYLIEKSFGLVHKMRRNKSIFSVDEFVYTGRFHKGLLTFVSGKELQTIVPIRGKFNYGYTLEGEAKEIFKVNNSLVCPNKFENRSFCYINSNSTISYIGDPFTIYSIYVRIYENCVGSNNNRWVVIWAQKPNNDEIQRMKEGTY